VGGEAALILEQILTFLYLFRLRADEEENDGGGRRRGIEAGSESRGAQPWHEHGVTGI
jgi:hypothetical protein